MTVRAPIFERDVVTLDQKRNLGVFEFEQLPSPGDTIHLAHFDGRYGVYRVLQINHEPTRDGEPLREDAYRAYVWACLVEIKGMAKP